MLAHSETLNNKAVKMKLLILLIPTVVLIGAFAYGANELIETNQAILKLLLTGVK